MATTVTTEVVKDIKHTAKGEVVYIRHLADEFEMSDKRIRSLLRNSGRHGKDYSAKGIYGWREGSKDLQNVRELLSKASEGVTSFNEIDPDTIKARLAAKK